MVACPNRFETRRRSAPASRRLTAKVSRKRCVCTFGMPARRPRRAKEQPDAIADAFVAVAGPQIIATGEYFNGIEGGACGFDHRDSHRRRCLLPAQDQVSFEDVLRPQVDQVGDADAGGGTLPSRAIALRGRSCGAELPGRPPAPPKTDHSARAYRRGSWR